MGSRPYKALIGLAPPFAARMMRRGLPLARGAEAEEREDGLQQAARDRPAPSLEATLVRRLSQAGPRVRVKARGSVAFQMAFEEHSNFLAPKPKYATHHVNTFREHHAPKAHPDGNRWKFIICVRQRVLAAISKWTPLVSLSIHLIRWAGIGGLMIGAFPWILQSPGLLSIRVRAHRFPSTACGRWPQTASPHPSPGRYGQYTTCARACQGKTSAACLAVGPPQSKSKSESELAP